MLKSTPCRYCFLLPDLFCMFFFFLTSVFVSSVFSLLSALPFTLPALLLFPSISYYLYVLKWAVGIAPNAAESAGFCRLHRHSHSRADKDSLLPGPARHWPCRTRQLPVGPRWCTGHPQLGIWNRQEWGYAGRLLLT